jgi:outer membrane protein OmpA-like peptidoglycan-associated protein
LKTIILISLLSSFSILLKAQSQQNLLINPSFEAENVCPEYHARCAPEGWWEVNLKESDYFTQQKISKSGNRSTAFTVMHYMYAHTKTYMYTRLLCPLEKDKTYRFNFWLKVPTFEMRPVGIFLSEREVLGNFNRDFTLKPTVLFTKTAALTKFKPNEWIEFSQTFVSKGNEKYLIIGNFEPDDPKKFGRHSTNVDRLLYHLDDISLVGVDSSQNFLCENAKAHADSLYHLDFRHILPKSQIPPVESAPKIGLGAPAKSVKTKLLKQNIDTLIIPNIVFAHNSDVISTDFTHVLYHLIRKIDFEKVRKMEIIGHTDNTGSDSYNEKLSLRRAHSIANYLITKQMRAEKITCIGRGETNPVADNHTEMGKQLNRRVEIILFF